MDSEHFSICDIVPDECPIDLRVKIEKFMEAEKTTWKEALVHFAHEVESP